MAKPGFPQEPKKNSSEFQFDRQKLIRIFFFVAFAFVLFQLFWLAKPFLTALLLAGMLAMGFFPVFLQLRRLVRNSNLAAFILTVAVFLSATIPLSGIGWFLFREADRLLPTVQSFLANLQSGESNHLREKFPLFIQSFMDPVLHLFEKMDIRPQDKILEYAGVIGGNITAFGAIAARHAIFMGINIVVFLLSLFFAFRDGESLIRWALSLIPMADEDKRALARRAYETFMAVVFGGIVTAGAQGLTAMFGFWIAGVKLPVILGFATMISSFFGASFLVTVPVALSIFSESTSWGIFLIIWGVLVVGLIDNVLKPILIGTRARMPFILIFFSIIGGIKAYGLLGFVLGPVVVASFLTFVNIYRKGYGERVSHEDDLPST